MVTFDQNRVDVCVVSVSVTPCHKRFIPFSIFLHPVGDAKCESDVLIREPFSSSNCWLR